MQPALDIAIAPRLREHPGARRPASYTSWAKTPVNTRSGSLSVPSDSGDLALHKQVAEDISRTRRSSIDQRDPTATTNGYYGRSLGNPKTPICRKSGGRQLTLSSLEPKRGLTDHATAEKTGRGPKNGPQQDCPLEMGTADLTSAHEWDAAETRGITNCCCCASTYQRPPRSCCCCASTYKWPNHSRRCCASTYKRPHRSHCR
ncbi:hypothetical protein NDU88_005989 [Pleurodeles waltl]|uniref:Uncharacterized protein n=1 Tax=Pleurodeles waltl TaxID=8319 RepID=A0AAV7N5X3_PLEWA|nr:hypothetical protein NDU88_005989 [Pleurodeles waltl]